MAVYDTDDYAHTPEHTTSMYDSRAAVQNPAVQSRSLKVLQRSLLLEYVCNAPRPRALTANKMSYP